MSPEAFAKQVEAALGAAFRSVVLYGSAAAGDHLGKRSDINILVVAHSLGIPELRALLEPTKVWTRAGNPPPLLFTETRLRSSCDIFPIELLDIKQSHRLLAGEDVLAKLEVSRANLRHQVEFELKGKLIKLREGYLLAGGKPKHVLELLMLSLAPLQVLLRAALRLYVDAVPASKQDATEELSRHIAFDTAPFGEVTELKAGTLSPKSVDADALFARYLSQLESIVDTVNDI